MTGPGNGNRSLAVELAERFIQYRTQVNNLAAEIRRYRSAIDLCPLPMLLVHEDGNLLYANVAYLDLVEDTLENVQGDGWSHVIHPEDRDRVKREWEEVIQGKREEYSSTFRVVRQVCGQIVVVLAKVIKTHFGYYIGILVPTLPCSQSSAMGVNCLANWLNENFMRPSHTRPAVARSSS